ncbi:hypothetical protein ACLOJK_013458 [Asimina triloba]
MDASSSRQRPSPISPGPAAARVALLPHPRSTSTTITSMIRPTSRQPVDAQAVAAIRFQHHANVVTSTISVSPWPEHDPAVRPSRSISSRSRWVETHLTVRRPAMPEPITKIQQVKPHALLLTAPPCRNRPCQRAATTHHAHAPFA